MSRSKEMPENAQSDITLSLAQLQQEMNSLFARCYNSAQAYIEEWGSKRLPLINIIDGGSAFYVEAALPGMPPGSVSAAVDAGMLTIKSEGLDAGAADVKYLRREMQTGPFTRSILLPGIVDSARSSSEFRDGMLTVTLPKKQGVAPAPQR